MKLLFFPFILVIAAFPKFISEAETQDGRPSPEEDILIAYVWEFKTTAGEINELTRSITDEYEEVLIQKNCYKVLQRSRYARLLSHITNEKSIGVNSISDFAKTELRVLEANTVIFGEIDIDSRNGMVRISISIESLTTSQILAKESILLHNVDLLDPRKLEAFVIELDDKVSKNLPCRKEKKTMQHIEFEGADDHTVGQVIYRGDASNGKVHGQFGCSSTGDHAATRGEILFEAFTFPSSGSYCIRIRYSNDGNSNEEVPIQISIDDELKASFRPKLTGDWNFFTETELIELGDIKAGTYNLKFETRGSQYGVADLDKFILYATK